MVFHRGLMFVCSVVVMGAMDHPSNSKKSLRATVMAAKAKWKATPWALTLLG